MQVTALTTAYGWGIFSWHTPSVVVALFASLAALVCLIYARSARRDALGRRTRTALTALLMLAGFSVIVLWPLRVILNLRPAVHHWDIAHYYLGAKYFEELGYDRLYDCIAVADQEDGVPRAVSGKLIRDLRTNTLERPLFVSPESCRPAFSESRWTAFRQDVTYFRERVPQEHDPGRWARLKQDHGFNATPLWVVLAKGLTLTGPASDARIYSLISIDLFLLTIMWIFAWRTFGAAPTALALIFWATNEPARFAWTSLAFLRHAWLFALVSGLCFLRRQRHGPAGVLLGLAALLRVFPGLVLVGLFATEAIAMIGRRSWRPSRPTRIFAVSAGATVLAGVLLSSFIADPGRDAWPRYFDQARKYAQTSMANSMGLKTLMYVTTPGRFSGLREEIRLEESPVDEPTGDAIESAHTWRTARVRLFESRRPLYLCLVLGLWALALWNTRKQPAWVAAVVFTGCALVTAELPSYYTAALLTVAFLSPGAPALGVALLAFAAVSRLLPVWFELGSQSAMVSSLLVVSLVIGTAWAARRERPTDHPG